jgi:hypothetical protein
MRTVLSSAIVAAAIATTAGAQSLTVVNSCDEEVFLFTQTSYGSISNDVYVAAGASVNMDISTTATTAWCGAINVGTSFLTLILCFAI